MSLTIGTILQAFTLLDEMVNPPSLPLTNGLNEGVALPVQNSTVLCVSEEERGKYENQLDRDHRPLTTSRSCSDHRHEVDDESSVRARGVCYEGGASVDDDTVVDVPATQRIAYNPSQSFVPDSSPIPDSYPPLQLTDFELKDYYSQQNDSYSLDTVIASRVGTVAVSPTVAASGASFPMEESKEERVEDEHSVLIGSCNGVDGCVGSLASWGAEVIACITRNCRSPCLLNDVRCAAARGGSQALPPHRRPGRNLASRP